MYAVVDDEFTSRAVLGAVFQPKAGLRRREDVHKQVVGRMGRVVLAQFEKDEDLMEGIVRILKDQKLRTGYIATITGALQGARIRRYPAIADDTENLQTAVVDMPGPIEASGHGIFGIVEAPDRRDKPFTKSNLVHGEPYVHIHLTATNAVETISGHLVRGGNLVKSIHQVSHFTIFIVEVVDAELQVRCDAVDDLAYHVITGG